MCSVFLDKNISFMTLNMFLFSSQSYVNYNSINLLDKLDKLFKFDELNFYWLHFQHRCNVWLYSIL